MVWWWLQYYIWNCPLIADFWQRYAWRSNLNLQAKSTSSFSTSSSKYKSWNVNMNDWTWILNPLILCAPYIYILHYISLYYIALYYYISLYYIIIYDIIIYYIIFISLQHRVWAKRAGKNTGLASDGHIIIIGINLALLLSFVAIIVTNPPGDASKHPQHSKLVT